MRFQVHSCRFKFLLSYYYGLKLEILYIYWPLYLVVLNVWSVKYNDKCMHRLIPKYNISKKAYGLCAVRTEVLMAEWGAAATDWAKRRRRALRRTNPCLPPSPPSDILKSVFNFQLTSYLSLRYVVGSSVVGA